MSLIHALTSGWPDYTRPKRHLYDQNFGCELVGRGLLDKHFKHALLDIPLQCGYIRPWRIVPAEESGTSNVSYNKKGFKVTLEVQHFKPDEIKVKVVDNYLVVEGKHEERSDDYGFISRQFTRRYQLPKDIDDSALVSNLSSDGVLMLEAPRKAVLPGCFYQEVPIVQTNSPSHKIDTHIQDLKRKKKNEKSLLPYYRDVPIVQNGEKKEGGTEKMDTK